MSGVGTGLVARAPQWSGKQLAGNWDVIWYYTAQHARYTITAIAIGCALAAPLVYAAHRWPRSYAPMLVGTNVVYAIPSLAMFVLLMPLLGLTNDKPVIAAMALYTLVILVRNGVEGLRAVPPEVRVAADAMGYRPARKFVRVELPLALPGIVAGTRLATVSTISLISVGAAVGRGGLGRVLSDGHVRSISTELWAGLIAIVALALVADALIVVAGRLLTPWTRSRV